MSEPVPAPLPAARPGRVASPCIGICQIDPRHGWCTGCLRTLDEIATWSRLDANGQRAVLALLPPRRLAADAPPPV
ncbi:DUF1289 domain-containing protein [Ideonella sp.]|uniref:DUF1289 domain-containing protein n=1 Tax=Ideonella sp. TaxID=1929293 RepID=UPI003BB53CE3